MFHRGLNVGKLFPFVTPHEEHARLDSAFSAQPDRLADLAYGDAPLHCVQDSLRPAFRADPHSKASHLGQCVRDAGVQPVGAGDALKRGDQPARLQLPGVLKQPCGVDGKDIVRHPEHVGPVPIEDPLHFIGYGAGGPPPMGVAVGGVAAPAAMIRAPAGGDHRHGAHAVMLAPDLHIVLDIDALAIRPG